MKIIIDIRDGISVEEAVDCIVGIMRCPRSSTSRGISKYCHHASWSNGTCVSTHDRRTETSADSFIVHKNKGTK